MESEQLSLGFARMELVKAYKYIRDLPQLERELITERSRIALVLKKEIMLFQVRKIKGRIIEPHLPTYLLYRNGTMEPDGRYYPSESELYWDSASSDEDEPKTIDLSGLECSVKQLNKRFMKYLTNRASWLYKC